VRPGESWPADLKAQARALYASDGLQLAAEVTQIPGRTLRHWAKTEQWPRPGDEDQAGNGGKRADLRLAPVPHAGQGPVKGQVVALGYGYQRRALLRQLGDLAGQAVGRASAELEQGHTAKARDAAVVLGIALDRAEALARAAGPDPSAQPEMAEVVGRLRELAADLQARKTGSDGQPG
jgi:hypothetical protein